MLSVFPLPYADNLSKDKYELFYIGLISPNSPAKIYVSLPMSSQAAEYEHVRYRMTDC